MEQKQWEKTLKQGKQIIKEASYARVNGEIDKQEVIWEIANALLNGKGKAIKIFQSESKKAIKKLKTSYPEIDKKTWDSLIEDAVEEIFSDSDTLQDFSEDFFGDIA